MRFPRTPPLVSVTAEAAYLDCAKAGRRPLYHASITGAQTSADCGTCHSYPGLATAPLPNWKDGKAMPTIISVGGFTIPSPPAATAGTVQQGIANLPHPPVGTGVACTTCHTIGGSLCFDPAEDPAAAEVQKSIGEQGVEAALRHYTGIDPASELGRAVVAAYRALRVNPRAECPG